MSLRPLKEKTYYCVQYQKPLKTQWGVLEVADPVVIKFDESNSIQIPLSDFQNLGSALKSDQSIYLKKHQILCQTAPIDSRAALYSDLILLARRNDKPSKATSARCLKSGEQVTVQQRGDVSVVIQYPEQQFVLRFETVAVVALNKAELTVGFKALKSDGLFINHFLFANHQDFQAFVAQLLQATATLQMGHVKFEESQPLTRKLDFDCEFQSRVCFQPNISETSMAKFTHYTAHKCEECSIVVTEQSVELRFAQRVWRIEINKIKNVVIKPEVKLIEQIKKELEEEADPVKIEQKVTKQEKKADQPLLLVLITGEKILLFLHEKEDQQILSQMLTKAAISNNGFKISFASYASNRMNPPFVPVNYYVLEQFVDFALISVETAHKYLENCPSFPIEVKGKQLISNLIQALKSQMNSVKSNHDLIILYDLLSQLLLHPTQLNQINDPLLQVEICDLIERLARENDLIQMSFLRQILSSVWNNVQKEQVYGFSNMFTINTYCNGYLNVIDSKQTIKQASNGYLELEHNLFFTKSISEEQLQVNQTFTQQMVKQRIEVEKDNRTYYLNQKKIISFLDKAIGNISTQSKLMQHLILGIFEDILIWHSHIDAKYFTELQQKGQNQFYPPGRVELIALILQITDFLLSNTKTLRNNLSNTSNNLIKIILLDKNVQKQIKHEICQKLLSNAAILKHVCSCVEKSEHYVKKIILMELIGACFITNKDVQVLISKIFPLGILRKFKSIDIQLIEKQPFQFGCTPFQGPLHPLQTIFEVLYSEFYELNIVWDDSMLVSLSEQLQSVIQHFEEQQNVVWNYEELNICYRGISNWETNELDIYVGQYVLSYIINTCDAELKKQVGQDNSNLYYKQWYQQRLNYIEALPSNTLSELKEREKLQSRLSLIGTQNSLKAPLLLSKLKNVDLSALMSTLFQSYLEAPDVESQYGSLHIMLLLAMLDAKFKEINQIIREISKQQKQQNMLFVFYLAQILERVAFNPNEDDMQNRNYWNIVWQSCLIPTICINILPNMFSKDFKFSDSLPRRSQLNLSDSENYTNLFCCLIRIVSHCINHCSIRDLNDQLLYPEPSLYGKLQSKTVLPIFLGLLLISLDDEQDEHARSTVFIEINKLLLVLCEQSENSLKFFVSAGFIEFLLSNKFGESENQFVFKVLQKLLAQPGVQSIVARFLPMPIVNYIKLKNQPVSIQSIFCSEDHISIIAIWNSRMRQYLQSSLGQTVQQMKVAVQSIDLQQILLSDADKLISENNCLLPIMWFEETDQHQLFNYQQFLEPHQQFEVGGVYLDLFSEQNFITTIKQQQTQLSDDEIKNTHKIVLQQLASSISLDESVSILLQITQLSPDASIEDIKQAYDANIFGPLGNFQIPNLTEATTFLLQICFTNLNSEVSKCKELHTIEQQVLYRVKQHKDATGTSGLNIIRIENLQHPDLLKQQRIAISNRLLRFFCVLGLIFKAVSSILKDQTNNFGMVGFCSIDALVGLRKQIQQLNCEQLIQTILILNNDISLQDIEIIKSIVADQQSQQKNQIQESIKLLIKFMFDISNQQLLTVEYANSFEQLILTIIQGLTQSQLDDIDPNLQVAIANMLQKLYAPDLTVVPSKQTDKSSITSNVLANLFRLIAKIIQVNKGTLLLSNNIPILLLRGIFDKKMVLVETLTQLCAQCTDLEKSIQPIITQYLIEPIQQKQSQLVIEKSLKLYFSDSTIFNPQVRSYLEQQINQFCNNCDVRQDQTSFLIKALNIDLALRAEIKIDNIYLINACCKIIQQNLLDQNNICSMYDGLNMEKLTITCADFLSNLQVRQQTEKLKVPILVATALLGFCTLNSKFIENVQQNIQVMNQLCKCFTILKGLKDELTVEVSAAIILNFSGTLKQQSIEAWLTHIIQFIIQEPQNSGTAFLVKQGLQTDPKKLRAAGFEPGYTDVEKLKSWFKSGLAPPTRRQLVCQILLQYSDNIANLDVIALNLVFKNLQNSTNNELIEWALGHITSRLLKSNFLKNMIPLSLRLALATRTIDDIKKFISSDVKTSELVWNPEISQQLQMFIQQMAGQMQQNIAAQFDWSNSNWMTSLKYFEAKIAYIANGFSIQVYNEAVDAQRTPALLQPDQTMVDIIKHIAANLNDIEAVVHSLRCLRNIIKANDRYIGLILGEHFGLLVEAIMSPQYQFGAAQSADLAAEAAGLFVQILGEVSRAKSVFVWDKLPVFFQMVVASYSYVDGRMVTQQVGHSWADSLFAYFQNGLGKPLFSLLRLVATQIVVNEDFRKQMLNEPQAYYDQQPLTLGQTLLILAKFGDFSAENKKVLFYIIYYLAQTNPTMKEELLLEKQNNFEDILSVARDCGLQFKFQGAFTEGQDEYPVPENVKQAIQTTQQMDINELKTSRETFKKETLEFVQSNYQKATPGLHCSPETLIQTITKQFEPVPFDKIGALKRSCLIAMQFGVVAAADGVDWLQ